tara:strand:+ start:373 stop:528 length:156 start_codon:yes stop_codon:yes gene_type:complete
MSRITGYNTRQALLEEFEFTFKFPPLYHLPVQTWKFTENGLMFGTQQEEDV